MPNRLKGCRLNHFYTLLFMNKTGLICAFLAVTSIFSCKQAPKNDTVSDSVQATTEVDSIQAEQTAVDNTADKKAVEEFVNSFYENALSSAEMSEQQLMRFLSSAYSDSFQELQNNAVLDYIDFLDIDGNTMDLCENISNGVIEVSVTLKGVTVDGNTASANVTTFYGDMSQPFTVKLVKNADGEWRIDNFEGTHGSARKNLKK